MLTENIATQIQTQIKIPKKNYKTFEDLIGLKRRELTEFKGKTLCSYEGI